MWELSHIPTRVKVLAGVSAVLYMTAVVIAL
jgi:hypothetical protein